MIPAGWKQEGHPSTKNFFAPIPFIEHGTPKYCSFYLIYIFTITLANVENVSNSFIVEFRNELPRIPGSTDHLPSSLWPCEKSALMTTT